MSGPEVPLPIAISITTLISSYSTLNNLQKRYRVVQHTSLQSNQELRSRLCDLILERASRSALMKYIIHSLIYVNTTDIYWSI